jgi:NAD(P)-dependent dehydrogenase (short-subunit alcohol dehydrogenase family)
MPVAVVTGASSGIGRAVAERLLSDGWSIVALARRTERLAEFCAGHAGAQALGCDVSDPAAVEAAFDLAVARFGRIDLLFNNAGVFPRPGLIDETTTEDWLRAVSVNLSGMFFCARAAFARMRRQDPPGGRIINNGSVAARAPRPGAVCYTVTKHGVKGLTRQLALDGRPFGIACGQIDIGNVQSDLSDQIGRGVVQADGSIRAEPMMPMADVVDAVMLMAGMPAAANVLDMTVMATTMPLVGRG